MIKKLFESLKLKWAMYKDSQETKPVVQTPLLLEHKVPAISDQTVKDFLNRYQELLDADPDFEISLDLATLDTAIGYGAFENVPELLTNLSITRQGEKTHVVHRKLHQIFVAPNVYVEDGVPTEDIKDFLSSDLWASYRDLNDPRLRIVLKPKVEPKLDLGRGMTNSFLMYDLHPIQIVKCINNMDQEVYDAFEKKRIEHYGDEA